MIRFLPIVCLVFVLSLQEDASAQRIPNYNRRPTVSPYINLFNNNQGGTNNYFSFVRPMQQQARLNQMQNSENRFLQQQLMNNRGLPNSQFQFGGGVGQQGLLRQGNQGVGMPSTAATFLNYSHFYPVQQHQGRRR